jgi:hypothetical protein
MKSAKAGPIANPPAQPKGRKPLAILFGIVALGYLLSFSGARYGRISDGKEMFATALSIYEFNALAIPSSSLAQDPQSKPEIYSKYGIGLPLVLQIPLFVADHCQSWFGWKNGDYLFPLTNLILNLLTALLIAVCARRLQLGWWAAYGAALAFAFGSFAWPYISFDFSEPLQAFCLISAFWALLRAFQSNQRQWAWLLLAGFLLGYAVLAKTLLVVAILPFAAYLWLNSRGSLGRKFMAQAVFGIPLACCGAVIGILNYMRFGSFLDTGYHAGSYFITPLWQGLYGLLAGPSKGLPWYAPLVLMLPLSCYWLYKCRRSELAFLCLLCGTLILPVAKWWSWEGGASWGPRLLYPLLPFLMLFSVYGTDRWKRARIPAALLLALGITVNVLGVLFYFSAWGNVCGLNGDLIALNARGRLKGEYQVKDGKMLFAPYIAMNYVPALSPVRGHAWVLRWRYFDVPFPMSSMLGQVPISKIPFGPVAINFEKLSQLAKDYPSFFREMTTAELLISNVLRPSSSRLGPFPIRNKIYAENGDRFAAKRDFPRAYYAYRKAYDLEYDTQKLLPKLGSTCFSLGRFEEAGRYFDQYLAGFPSDQKVRLLYARALEATRQYARSLEQYRQLPRTDLIDERIAALTGMLNPGSRSTIQREIKK